MNHRSSVFISRNRADLRSIHVFAEQANVALVCSSMIVLDALEPLPNLNGIGTLFFSSPGAVELFYAQSAYRNSEHPVAAIGKGTASALPSHIQPVFVGEGTTDEAVEAFIRQGWEGELGVIEGRSSRKVFERVTESIHPLANFRSLVIYQTNLRPQAIGSCDAWAFTSPSNYEAFVRANPSPPAHKCVAIGEATAASIGDGVHIAANYSEVALWDAILSALRS